MLIYVLARKTEVFFRGVGHKLQVQAAVLMFSFSGQYNIFTNKIILLNNLLKNHIIYYYAILYKTYYNY